MLTDKTKYYTGKTDTLKSHKSHKSDVSWKEYSLGVGMLDDAEKEWLKRLPSSLSTGNGGVFINVLVGINEISRLYKELKNAEGFIGAYNALLDADKNRLEYIHIK